MKRILFTVLILVAVAACATANLPANPTPEQKRVAMCQDAQAAYIFSVAALDQILSSTAEVAYWQAYRRGAELALIMYCQNPQPTPPPSPGPMGG